MQAIVYHGPGNVRPETVPEPSCSGDEIRVNVDACAVCGSDLKAYRSGNPRMKPPMVMGHEFTGLIDTVGADVTGFGIGDRIVMATSVSCGNCPYCERGWPNLCANIAPMGFSYPGGMAEYVTIPAIAIRRGHVVTVPADIPPEHAAMAEPVSCAVNCIENCGLRKGDTVVVMGAGPMGLINACVAKQMGAGKVIVTELNESRLAHAAKFGFHRLVNAGTEDLADVVMSETGGIGADIAIVAAPAAQPQEQAVGLVRKRGTVCLFASLPKGKSSITLDSRPIHYGELRVVGCSDSTPEHVKTAVSLISSGSFPVADLATHVLPLEQIARAFELMESGESLRVVLKP